MKQSRCPLWIALLGLALSTSVATNAVADAPREIAKRVSPSVVLLVMEDSGGQPLAMGSGFIVREGVVATNMHVIEGAARGYARLIDDEARHDIRGIVASDAARDLVLLSVDGLKAEALRIGDSDEVAAGDAVYAVGNPRGLEGTFSAGIVSSVRKLGDDSLLQITAPISPGSSGGPVVNGKGEVIGVAVATFKGGQNLNFAIPSSYLSLLVPAIKASVDLPKAAEVRNAKKEKSILDGMGGKSTEGMSVETVTWDSYIQSGEFSLSLHNRLRDSVRNVHCLVIFYDPKGTGIDFTVVQYRDAIPPGLSKRVKGRVEDITEQLNSPPIGGFHGADPSWQPPRTPRSKVEIRVLGFDIVTSDEPTEPRSDATPRRDTPRVVPAADEQPVAQEEQGPRQLTDLMTKEEFRACGLHKLSGDELVRLNMWLSKGIATITDASRNAGDDIPLFDKTGDAVAYLDPADEMTIYMWSGKPVAYVSDKSVYGFNGRHLGWFAEGVIYDPKAVVSGQKLNNCNWLRSTPSEWGAPCGENSSKTGTFSLRATPST